MTDIHLNNEGTTFIMTIMDGASIVDISTFTTLQLIFDPPIGSKKTMTASLTTDGTDGKMEYTTSAGMIDETGTWSWQGKIAKTNFEYYTSILTFEVLSNL